MAGKRYLDKFTSLDGTSFSYTFPPNLYEAEGTQGLRSPRAQVVGMDYQVRLRGDAVSLKDVGRARLRGVFVGTAAEQDAEQDEARSNLYLGAFGKLWTIDESNARRWCRAELAEMPELLITWGKPGLQAVVYGFNLFSDFFDEDAMTATATVTTSPQDIVVTNPGNVATRRMTIRLRANASGGITNPKIVNGANAYEFQSTRDSASANSELRLDTRRPAVEYSNDNGTTYADDFASYVLPPVTQRVLSFQLEPGSNTLTVTCGGTPNFDFELEADAPYA